MDNFVLSGVPNENGEFATEKGRAGEKRVSVKRLVTEI